jgi:hypothetical protein
MDALPAIPACDGCGLPASPEHIAERLRRLELSTKFRPIHIGVLFVALAPAVRPQDDFYGPPESKEFFDPFLEALEIPTPSGQPAPGPEVDAPGLARLAEFQRRGFYLAFLSECPMANDGEPVETTVSRLGPALVRRIRFNYKPKQIALLGERSPLAGALKDAGLGPLLKLDQGTGLAAVGYDRIRFTRTAGQG